MAISTGTVAADATATATVATVATVAIGGVVELDRSWMVRPLCDCGIVPPRERCEPHADPADP